LRRGFGWLPVPAQCLALGTGSAVWGVRPGRSPDEVGKGVAPGRSDPVSQDPGTNWYWTKVFSFWK
jgi:hypothetical protein